MQKYAQMDEATSHFMCGNTLHQVGQDEFNKEVAAMEDSVSKGRTMSQDMQDGINNYFGDLGITPPNLTPSN